MRWARKNGHKNRSFSFRSTIDKVLLWSCKLYSVSQVHLISLTQKSWLKDKLGSETNAEVISKNVRRRTKNGNTSRRVVVPTAAKFRITLAEPLLYFFSFERLTKGFDYSIRFSYPPQDLQGGKVWRKQVRENGLRAFICPSGNSLSSLWPRS